MRKKKIKSLIFGISGQDGSYLSRFLLNKKNEVYGVTRNVSKRNLKNLIRLEVLNKVKIIKCDAANFLAVKKLIRIIKPNEIYNLAAQSHVKASFEIPEYTGQVDGMGVIRLLEIIRSVEPIMRNKIRFYQAGTSEMYGKALEMVLTGDMIDSELALSCGLINSVTTPEELKETTMKLAENIAKK